MAERRREELNRYIWHLTHAAPEVAEVSGPAAVGFSRRSGLVRGNVVEAGRVRAPWRSKMGLGCSGSDWADEEEEEGEGGREEGEAGAWLQCLVSCG